MSIASEITRLQGAKADLKTAIEGKGVTVPSATKLDGYADLVDAISQGGGATLITKNISANGTYNASSDSADGYSQVNVSVPASAVDSGTKNITANGNNQDVVGYAAVNVNVPNTYAAGDEGKVVSNGALVAQTAHADVTPTTSDQTIDTTQNNSLKVKGDADLVAGNIKKDVEIFGVTGSYEGGGGGSVTAETGTVTLASDYALSTAATGAAFPGLRLDFEPDFFYMTMENASWNALTSPGGALYGFCIVKKSITPPFRINSSMSTDGLSLDYYAYGMYNTVAASDVTNGFAINGFALMGSGYVERFHFDSSGYVYVGRYSSASTYAKAGTYRYFAYKLPTT